MRGIMSLPTDQVLSFSTLVIYFAFWLTRRVDFELYTFVLYVLLRFCMYFNDEINEMK